MHTFQHSLPLAFTTAITSHLNVSLPSVPLCHLLRDPLFGSDLVLQSGEFLAPPLLKITNCLVLSLLI